jgi:hypothetical protein
MSECLNEFDTSEPFDGSETLDDALFLDDEPESEEEKGTSIWFLIAAGVVIVALIWIILGVWRYLQVLGNGTF